MLDTINTKEIVLRKPRARYFHLPVLLDGDERVDSFKLLALVFQNNFKFDAHLSFVLRQCSQRRYLLKLLQCQGMNSDHLEQITDHRHHHQFILRQKMNTNVLHK